MKIKGTCKIVNSLINNKNVMFIGINHYHEKENELFFSLLLTVYFQRFHKW